MITFRPVGPFAVTRTRGRGGRLIDKEAAERFWTEHPDVADAVGCYVFGVRAGKGYLPLYVGKASVAFRREAFEDKKLTHYNTALLHRAKGTPVMFFVIRESGPLRSLDSCLGHIEHFLIQVACEKNPDLRNIHRLEYRILGVFRRGEWPLSPGAKQFRRMLGL